MLSVETLGDMPLAIFELLIILIIVEIQDKFGMESGPEVWLPQGPRGAPHRGSSGVYLFISNERFNNYVHNNYVLFYILYTTNATHVSFLGNVTLNLRNHSMVTRN